MQNFFEAILEHTRSLHASALQVLDGLPAEALDWVPGPEMNSFSVLTFHFTGAERYWISDVILRQDSHRDRAAEFLVKGLDAAALRKRISDLDAFESSALGGMTLEQLGDKRVSPRDGKQVSVAWALTHVLEHTGVHIGHIEILLQQWKQRAGA